ELETGYRADLIVENKMELIALYFSLLWLTAILSGSLCNFYRNENSHPKITKTCSACNNIIE
ncbi:MAG TPA: hypothetical protein VKS21_06815, partial [Spirochaetota bacterium]|nr:hypothetical protein [Spirochaetota bacterium]